MTPHLNTEQRAQLETMLLQHQAALAQDLSMQLGGADRATHAREALLQDGDDESAHDSDRLVDLTRSDTTMASLSQVNTALTRLQDPDSSYGLCSACAAAIPFERLQHSPAALRCITCQAALEARGGSDPSHRPSI